MTNTTARSRLHHKLIDLDDRPCLWCGSKLDREIDRIIQGGQYIMSNVRVLCVACHIKRHNKKKFAVGDKVQINGRCPKWLVNELRHNRLRTVIAAVYDNEKQCCYYQLGNNYLNDAGWDVDAYSFRSYMLVRPIKRGAGRPRTKRQYLRKNCTDNSCSPILDKETEKQYPDNSRASQLAQNLIAVSN